MWPAGMQGKWADHGWHADADRRVSAAGGGLGGAVGGGKIRADVVHDKLLALGFTGSERTTRRAVAAVRPPTGWGGCGCTGRGSPSLACGCSTTSVTAR